METIRNASCLCEGVQFTVQGKPENVFACYCSDCQKNAGAPYQLSAKFPKSEVKIEQGEDLVGTWIVKKTISGSEKHKVFCKRCGCTLWTIPMAHGGDKYIVRTALVEDGLQLFKPLQEFYSAMRPEIVIPFEGTKKFDTMPGR